jgi:predicted DNA-binding transcriptional regulator YafY
MHKPFATIPDESKLKKAQRFVRIIQLMQQQGGVEASDLLARFDLDDRTLRRYLADLKDLGIPIRDEGRGAGRHLWLEAAYGRQGVQITLLELVALRFGRSMVDFLEGTGFAQDMDDALETLSTLAGEADMARAKDLDRKFMAVPEHRKDHTGDADLIEDILSALIYQNPAEALYARVGGRTKSYRLHTLTLATYRQGLYLFALDVKEGKIKTFAVDRFRHFSRIRGEHFDYPEDHDPTTMLQDAFGIIGGEVQDVILRFNRRASPYVRERIWHQSQVLTQLEDGGVLLKIRVGVAHELVSWIMGFGPDVCIEAPAELSARVRDLHRDAAEGWELPSGRRA